MPHVTQAYPFEGKVLEFAGKLTAMLTGDSHTFLIVFQEDGTAQTVTFEQPSPSWHDVTQELTNAGKPYLFYDPFEAEYTWLIWQRIERATMERLIGRPFVESDFVAHPAASSRAPSLAPAHTYPVSWGVMF